MAIRDAIAETVYPSIAALTVGRWCGMLLNALPLRIGRLRLTHLIFGPLVAPLAAGLYVLHKMIGCCYPLTQSAVEAWPMIGTKRIARVELDRIATIETVVRSGQAFYRAGDVVLRDSDGGKLLTLNGVPQPERVASLIEQLRLAATQRDYALATIAARSQPAEAATK